jgi:hypothetical protein
MWKAIASKNMLKFIVSLGVLPFCIAGVLWGWFHVPLESSLEIGVIVVLAIVAIGGPFVLCAMAVSLIRDVPRLEVGPDGFVVRYLMPSHSRRWSDIEGEFTVRELARFGKVVVYCLTEAFKKSQQYPAQKMAEEMPGIDDFILNNFEMSPDELAELLNDHKRRALGSSQSV